MSKKNEPGMAYNMSKLNKVFAVLSIIFLMTTLWVFLDDYLRPWKLVQIEAMKVKKNKLEKDLLKEVGKIDLASVKKIEESIKSGQVIVDGRKGELDKVDKELRVILKNIQNETIENGKLNASISAIGFQQGKAWAHHDQALSDKLFAQMTAKKVLFAESKDRLKALVSKKKAAKKSMLALQAEVLEKKKELTKLTSTRELLKIALSKTKTDPLWALRNLPFIDFLDPTLKIQQVVMKNITDDRYFQHVAKVDRCTTCHTFIDKPGYETEVNPHKTHPKLDLMLGKNSPHPLKSFGCTTCHGGEGHRVHDFNSIAHMPENEEQKADWVAKYNWHEPHKVPQVMFKKSMTEAGCVKCHSGVEYIPQATVLNEGRKNIEKFGCYGCHKIEGWEHKRKPGPSLLKISSKVSKKFFKSWVWSPKSFNAHAKMPAFFNQDNNRRPDFMKKNIAEVDAIAEFVWSKSQPYKPFMRYTGGDAKKGKELIASVGCIGCHGVEGFPVVSEKIDAYAGPYLTGTGSKVNADWLASWLKKPSHYQEDTIMPSFRLSDREVNDLTAYLMSLKNKKFEKLNFEKADKVARDEILLAYFSAFDTAKVANAKLDQMSDREKTLELGERSVGKYGCYSCHNIDGFDGRAPIGPELSKVGSKPLTQFGYSHEHDVEHSRDGWIQAHLINPRRWDNGIDKTFQDLLRMPNFYMTASEAKSITTALIGQVGDYIPVAGIKRLSANEQIAEDGMKVVTKFNCIGCHQVDGFRGDVLAHFSDDLNEGPPRLVGQGHRVQTDWFYKFLGKVEPIRPWLKIRMPSFNLTNEEKNKIVTGFQAKSSQKTFEDVSAEVVWLPGEKLGAQKLFKSLDCVTCHAGGFTNEEASAPNLHLANKRLRPSWIRKWLKNPQAILEGTVMPSFWEDGESTDTEVFDGDAERQISALTKYVLELGEK